MKLTITGYSTALFATWYFIEELGLLFDAGDGVTAGLLQKSRKVKHIFVSHADRDHITGLLQFNQLNAREGFPVIYYPKDSGSFPAMENFFNNFDPHMNGAIWKPISGNTSIGIKENTYVRTIRNGHVPVSPTIQKSLSFQLYTTKRKLKPEFQQLTKTEIMQTINMVGRDQMTEEINTNILGYSGDTPVEDLSRWENTNVLIHEATFLGNEEKPKGNKHSRLEEVIEMISKSHIEKVVLGHFSSRYSTVEIEKAVKDLCEKYAINIPVYCVVPGAIHRNILSEKPVNQ